MAQNKHSILIFIRILVGIFFITSGLTKLFSVDSFEVYVFSFGAFNLNISFILARVLIGFELVIGLLCIVGLYLRLLTYLILASLIGFTVLLTVLQLQNNADHCHCFGDVIPISNTLSIVKNLVLIGLSLFILKSKQVFFRFQKFVAASCVIAGFALSFIVSPPDTFSMDLYAARSEYNKPALNAFLQTDSTASSKEIICFFGSGCRFCKLASKKISVIYKNAQTKVPIRYVFWGNETSIAAFFALPNTIAVPYSTLPSDTFLTITNGHMPLIVLIKNRKIVSKYSYRDINDKEITSFLKNGN